MARTHTRIDDDEDFASSSAVNTHVKDTRNANNDINTDQTSIPGSSLWHVPTAELLKHPGTSKEINLCFPAPSGIGDEFYGVHPDSSITVEGSFDTLTDGLLFNGHATAHITGSCARCLKDISEEKTVDITAFFPSHGLSNSSPQRHVEGTFEALQDEAEDVYPLIGNGDFADMEPLLRDSFAEIIPLSPLCSSTCKGICDQCGVSLAQNPGHHHEVTNHCWDALKDFKKELESHSQTTEN